MINRRTIVAGGTATLIPGGALGACATATSRSADDLTKPLRVSANGRYLAQPNGRPFFWMGDTGWALFTRTTREDADFYLRDRAAKGFNVVQAVAIGFPLDGLQGANRYGDLTLLDLDLTQPNPRFFDHVDWVVACAAQYGVRIAMLPVWGASIVAGFTSNGPVLDVTTAHTLGRWFGARYRDRGIIWVLGGDTNPLWPAGFDFLAAMRSGEAPAPEIVDYRPVYDALAAGLVEAGGGNQFITYHPCPLGYPGAEVPRTSAFFSDRPWLDMNMIQSSHWANVATDIMPFVRSSYNMLGVLNYRYIREEYDSRPVRPVVDGEPRYEGTPVDITFDPNKGIWDTYDTRNAAYHAVFAGAAGHTYGGTVQIFSTTDDTTSDRTWREDLELPGARQMQHLKALMLSRPYFSRIPDDSIVRSPQIEGEAYVSATRDSEGSYLMAYAPKGDSLTLDLSVLAGRGAVAWWFDPRTGTAHRVNDLPQARGAHTFIPPTRGDDQDWVLVVDSGMASPPPGRGTMVSR